MRKLRNRLTELVKGMEFFAVCVVGLPLLLLYGIVWLVCAGLIFVAGAAVVSAPIVLAVWGWDKSRWLGAFIIACYIVLYLGWRLFGEQILSDLRARGWLRTRGAKRQQSSN